MLTRFRARGFKSLRDLDVEFTKLTVLFGPNSGGKSNLLDALLLLTRIPGFDAPVNAFAAIRGTPLESFSFPSGGLADLLTAEEVRCRLSGTFAGVESVEYEVEIAMDPQSGRMWFSEETVRDMEHAITIAPPRWRKWGEPPVASDGSISLEVWLQTSAFSFVSLDLHDAVRRAATPKDVMRIGGSGEDLAPFLYRLQAEQPEHFDAVTRTLRAIIPTIESLSVDLDPRRGTLDIHIRQDGVDFSSTIVSEGTLRVLALCAIAANPWGESIIAIEEPENGVHPRRIELIADLLASVALDQGRQVIVTTHSPLFCEAILRHAREHPDDVSLLNVKREHGDTRIEKFPVDSPMLTDPEIVEALSASGEDGIFERLLLRGLL